MDENQNAVIRLSVSAPSPNPVHPENATTIRPAATSHLTEISKGEGIFVAQKILKDASISWKHRRPLPLAISFLI